MGRGGHFYTPPKTQAYEKKVAWLYKSADRTRMGCRTPLHIELGIRRKGKTGPDGDNAFKVVADAISKARNENDKNYTGGWVFLESGEPRVEVMIL